MRKGIVVGIIILLALCVWWLRLQRYWLTAGGPGAAFRMDRWNGEVVFLMFDEDEHGEYLAIIPMER